MKVSILIATCGDQHWQELVRQRAFPSAEAQGAYEVLVRHEPEGTLASVRNAVAAQAEGDWLCFLDADDELSPGFYREMKRAWKIPSYQTLFRPDRVLFTPAVVFTASRHRKRYHGGKIWPEIDLREGNWLCIGTLVPTPLFHELGGFREWPIFEDWDLWSRCAKAGAYVDKVPRALYIAHVMRGSRNRVADTPERDYWHQRIGHDNWPDYYEATTPDEDASRSLMGVRKRQAA